MTCELSTESAELDEFNSTSVFTIQEYGHSHIRIMIVSDQTTLLDETKHSIAVVEMAK